VRNVCDDHCDHARGISFWVGFVFLLHCELTVRVAEHGDPEVGRLERALVDDQVKVVAQLVLLYVNRGRTMQVW